VTEFSYSGNPTSLTGGSTTVTSFAEGTGGSSNQVVDNYIYGELQSEVTGTGSSASTKFYVRDPASGLAQTVVDGDFNSTVNNFDDFTTSGTYFTDADNLSSTDGAGNTTDSAYTSLNEPYCTVDAADVANGVTCPVMTNIASGSGGASLPQSTIDVASSVGFVATSPLAVPTTAGIQSVSCTGSTSTTFTGCSGGTGTTATGDSVIQSATAPTRGSDPWPGATITFYDAVGNAIFNVTARGGVSQTAYTTASGGVPELPYCTVDAVEYGADNVTCPSTPPVTPPGSPTGYTVTIYDSSGNVSSSTTPTDATTSSSYGDPAFPTLATQVTDPDGTVTTNTYDSAGRLTMSVQSFGSYSAATVTAYDSAGNTYCSITAQAYAQGDTSCPAVTAIASGSAGGSLGGTGFTIYVGSTAGFVPLAPLAVPTTGGIESVTCTGETSSTFTGCSGGSGSMAGGQTVTQVPTSATTIASGSNGASLPQSTIYVASTNGLSTLSPEFVVDTSSGIESITCNGMTLTTFTGCSGGTGTMSTGNPIAQYVSTTGAARGSDPWPGDTVTFFDADGHAIYAVNPLGGVTQTAYNGTGQVYCTVAPLAYDPLSPPAVTCPTSEPTSSIPTSSSVTTTISSGSNGASLPQTTIDVASTTGFSVSWRIEVDSSAGVQSVYCTGDTSTTFTGCTGGSGTVSTGGAVSQLNDPYLGATVTTHNPLGQVSQVTNPLGGITLTTYDLAGNVHETQVESNDSTHDPTITTTYTYDGDNRLTETTLGSSETTVQAYDPDGNVYCTVSAKNEASHSCPTWTDSWIATPPIPSTVITSNPDVSTSFYDADGDQLQTTDADGHTTVNAYDADGHTYCSSDPTNADAWLAAHTSSTYPYLCPSTAPTSAPTGTTTGYMTTIYDADGNTLSSTDQVGDTTSYTYDAAGDKTEMTDPRSEATTYCYYGDNGIGGCATGANAEGFSAYQSGVTTLSAVSCVAPYFCAAVNGNGRQDTFSGSDWSSSDIDASRAINAVSCVTSSFCMAVDNVGHAIGFGESGWGSPTTIDSTVALNGVSCTESLACVAVDSSGQEVTYNAGWGSPTTIDSGHVLNSVSCVTETFCMAVDNSGDYVELNGTWGSPTSIDAGHHLTGVSCVSTMFCMAVDNHGDALHWNGTSWTFSTSVDGTNVINSVSCVTSSFCVASDADGDGIVWNGSAWSVTTGVDGTHSLNGVSCSSTNFCLAGLGNGDAVFFNGTGLADELFSQTTPSTTADPSGETTSHSYYPGSTADVTTTPSGATTDSYDVMGDLVTQDNANASTGFDAAPSVSYGYYSDGERSLMEDGNGITEYVPDQNDDVTEAQFFSSSSSIIPSSTVKYTYYSTGAIDAVTYPSYGTYTSPAATYTYDDFGNSASVSDWLGNTVSLCYDADNNLTTQSNASSSCTGTNSTTFSYDAADQNSQAVSDLSCSSTALTQSFSGTSGSRNDDGLVTEDGQSFASGCGVTSPGSRFYSYDAAARVAYEGINTQGSNPANFAYDAAGNPKTFSTLSGSTLTTHHNSYDNAGEITCENTTTGCTGATSSYTYDTLGDRASETTGSTTTDYNYNQIAQLTGTTVSSTPTSTNTYTGDGLEASALANTSRAGWSAAAATGDTHPINSVSCPTASLCMAVDNAGDYLDWNGSSWSSVASVGDSGRPLESVSCPSPSACMAVDNHGNAVSWNGSSWTVTGIDGTHTIDSVSCPIASSSATANLCVAVDNNDNYLTYSGTSWTSASWSSALSVSDSSRPLESVSCPISTFCEAVDNAGNAVTYNGSSWSVHTLGIGSSVVNSVSCTSPSFCAAVDAGGNAATGSGSTWQAYDNTTGSSLASVSCASADFCAAITGSGHVVSFNGFEWSAVTSIDTANTLESVSCPNEAFCDLVDNAGNTLSYAASQFVWDTDNSIQTALTDGTNDYVYGPSGEPVEEVNVTTATSASAGTFMTYTPGDSSWLFTNSSGVITGFTSYDAFGTTSSTSGLAQPTGYAGQYQGTAANVAGFENMRARTYDAQTGAFTTRDPDFSQTDEAYVYANDDPVNQTDPSGECTSFNIYCYNENLGVVQQINNNGAPETIQPSQAERLLVINNFSQAGAASWIASFTGTILITTAQFFNLPFYRYYGPNSIMGWAVTNGFWTSSATAIQDLVLPNNNRARRRAQAAPNYDFANAWYLVGRVTNSPVQAWQIMSYDVHEWVYGPSVPTSSSSNPPV